MAPVEPPVVPVEEPVVVPDGPELGEEPDIQIAAPSPPSHVSDDQVLAGEFYYFQFRYYFNNIITSFLIQ